MSGHVSKIVLNRYIGYMVRIVFFDDEVAEGQLGYTSKFCAEQGWRKPFNYTIGNTDFKTSHVKHIEII